ncbi:hypothetical protein BPAE_0071g00440 [Botrytis paeoniae]|uniref:Uncharacterized protein n=1 Tax=Botrytis paeoniae TaxID=278948 RepID=A0A4Z1FSI4_9HELO|nr:hypothetical protein BPAE_0071g00440 [Botrytis paeoniae]
MSATWSFLGARADGWYPEDEENWGKAVDILVENIEAGPYYSKLPSGNIALRMVANRYKAKIKRLLILHLSTEQQSKEKSVPNK